MEHLSEIFILIMLAIVLLQSGIDKIMDWKGNLGWLNSHFSKTIFKNMVSFNLMIVLLLEMLAGLLSLIGAIMLLINGNPSFAIYGAVLAAVNFCCLLLGQRIAKDYVGAQTIVIYMIPTVFLLYLLNN